MQLATLLRVFFRALLCCAGVPMVSAPLAGGSPQAGATIQVEATFYRLQAPINVNTIKAIGSPQTKSSPSILHVAKAEATRISTIATKAGATDAGSQTVKTKVDQAASITGVRETGSTTLEVTPSTRGSDTITLRFKLSIVDVNGTRRITRSASGMARVQESKALLIIENPRNGQPGLLAVVQARRIKAEN